MVMSRKVWSWVFVCAAVGLAVTGCATQETEDYLSQAGFQKKVALTPTQLAHLESLSQHRLVHHQRNGRSYYVYADASDCRCMYVGDENNYRQYQEIMDRIEGMEAEEPVAEGLDPEMNWELWNVEQRY